MNTTRLWSYVYVSGGDEFFAIVASNPRSSVMSNTLELKIGTTTNATIVLWNNPISISSNIDFANQAVRKRVGGDGSSGNPYVISNLQIRMSSNPTYGIAISNTNCYFNISNVLINGAGGSSNGINLNNVTNGTIAAVNVTGCNNGISVTGSFNTIQSNYIQSCSGNGISGISVSGSFNTVNNNAITGVTGSNGL